MKIQNKDLIYYISLLFFVCLPFLVHLFTSSAINKNNDVEVFVGEPVTVTPTIVIPTEAKVGEIVDGKVTLNASASVKINGAVFGILIPKNLEVSEVKIGEKLDNFLSESAALKFTKDYNASYHLIQFIYLNNTGVTIPNTPVTIFTYKLKGSAKGTYELVFNTATKPEIKGLISATEYAEYYTAGSKKNIEFKDPVPGVADTASPTCGEWVFTPLDGADKGKIKVTAKASDAGVGLVRGGLYISSKPNTGSADFGAIPNNYTFGPQKDGTQNYIWDTNNLAPGKYTLASNWWDNSGKPSVGTTAETMPGGHLGNFIQCRKDYTIEVTPPVVDRPDYCKSISLSTAETNNELKVGETLTLKSVSKVNTIKNFSFAFYNKDNLTTGQTPTPKGVMYEPGKQFYSSFVPLPNDPVYIGSTQVSYADLYKPDTNWGNKIPQNIQVNAYFTDGDNKVSRGDPVCVSSFNLKPKATNNVIDWKTKQAEFKSENFSIQIGNKTFTAKTGSITDFSLSSDPSTTKPTLEATWKENGVEMRMFMYFQIAANGTDWEMYELRTYNGQTTPDWLYYKDSTNTPLKGVTGTPNFVENREFIPVNGGDVKIVCGKCSINVFKPLVSEINYSKVKDLTSVIRLDKRTDQEGVISTIGHAHPNIYVGLWRPSTNKMLAQALTKTAADGNFSIPNFFSKNGISNDVGYTLEKTDLIIIKPESYLSKSYTVESGYIGADDKSLIVKDVSKPFLGGDLLIDIGTFDVVNVRDYVLMRNYYGAPNGQKQDQYYLDYNGNGYIDVRDFALYNTNLGKKGSSESLNRSLIDVLTNFVKTSLYQVIIKP